MFEKYKKGFARHLKEKIENQKLLSWHVALKDQYFGRNLKVYTNWRSNFNIIP